MHLMMLNPNYLVVKVETGRGFLQLVDHYLMSNSVALTRR